MKLVDAHCHLEGAEADQADAIVQRAREAGIVHAVLVGQLQKPGDFGRALEIARKFPDYFTPTLGIHPHEAANAHPSDLDALEKLCALPEIAAVGEAGLDYFYDHSPRTKQRELFARQCALAKTLKKPLVVHVRDAHADCAEVLRAEKVERGVIHCFTGDTEAARVYLSLGFSLSISGIVTYKKTDALQEAVKFAPIDRLMVETDSPYLAPVPHRGKKNEPAYVREVAAKVAMLKSMTVEAVAEGTAINAARMFGFEFPSRA
jgi:TatD DNase family protein